MLQRPLLLCFVVFSLLNQCPLYLRFIFKLHKLDIACSSIASRRNMFNPVDLSRCKIATFPLVCAVKEDSPTSPEWSENLALSIRYRSACGKHSLLTWSVILDVLYRLRDRSGVCEDRPPRRSNRCPPQHVC